MWTTSPYYNSPPYYKNNVIQTPSRNEVERWLVFQVNVSECLWQVQVFDLVWIVRWARCPDLSLKQCTVLAASDRPHSWTNFKWMFKCVSAVDGLGCALKTNWVMDCELDKEQSFSKPPMNLDFQLGNAHPDQPTRAKSWRCLSTATRSTWKRSRCTMKKHI